MQKFRAGQDTSTDTAAPVTTGPDQVPLCLGGPTYHRARPEAALRWSAVLRLLDATAPREDGWRGPVTGNRHRLPGRDRRRALRRTQPDAHAVVTLVQGY